MKSFTIYEEYFDLITLLPTEEEQKDFLYKIVEYMFYDKKPKLNTNQIKIFNNLKRPLDKSKLKSKATSKRNQNEIKIESETNQNKNTSNDVNVNVNVKSNKGGMGGKERFKPPTLEEVSEYCKERNNGINAQSFIDFYESKGWMIGKNKMKDWKACIRTWEKKIAPATETPKWFEEIQDIDPVGEEVAWDI